MKISNEKHVTRTGIIKKNPLKVLYHGSNAYFPRFNADNLRLDSTDQEGVGIYLTDSLNGARYYGKYVYVVQLQTSKIVPLKGKVSKKELMFLINNANKEDRETTLSNYGETNVRALQNFFNLNQRYENQPHEYFKTIWYEFYRYNPKQFLINMNRLGYEYVKIPQQNKINHYVVYNWEKIKIVKIINNRGG